MIVDMKHRAYSLLCALLLTASCGIEASALDGDVPEDVDEPVQLRSMPPDFGLSSSDTGASDTETDTSDTDTDTGSECSCPDNSTSVLPQGTPCEPNDWGIHSVRVQECDEGCAGECAVALYMCFCVNGKRDCGLEKTSFYDCEQG